MFVSWLPTSWQLNTTGKKHKTKDLLFPPQLDIHYCPSTSHSPKKFATFHLFSLAPGHPPDTPECPYNLIHREYIGARKKLPQSLASPKPEKLTDFLTLFNFRMGSDALALPHGSSFHVFSKPSLFHICFFSYPISPWYFQ